MADFNPSGVWEVQVLVGSEPRGQVTFDIGPMQPDGSFSGSANGVLGTGQGSGWALGRLFVFKVDWPNRTAHLFSGWLGEDRFIKGSLVMVGAPQSSAGWGSVKQF